MLFSSAILPLLAAAAAAEVPVRRHRTVASPADLRRKSTGSGTSHRRLKERFLGIKGKLDADKEGRVDLKEMEKLLVELENNGIADIGLEELGDVKEIEKLLDKLENNFLEGGIGLEELVDLKKEIADVGMMSMPGYDGPILAASANPDPHYTVWDGKWYDFQGGCDQIAIDNPWFQLQIRTRPRQWYSTITQVALKIKPTGEVFKLHVDGRLENTLTSASGAVYTSSPSTHIFAYGQDSFMRFSKSSYGISLQVQGPGHIFADSEGMLGSWNDGGVNFRDGTPFDLSGGYSDVKERSIQLAASWAVPISESLLWDPSGVCDASSECGTGHAFACEDVRMLREESPRRLGTCTRTCDDITVPFAKEQCKIDVALTGDTDWACEPNYVDPVVGDVHPADLPTPKWYAAGGGSWPNGHCVLSSSDYGGSKGPGYETNLECCKKAYGGQMSNECIDRLESPPTVSPTAEGGLDEPKWYAAGGGSWPNGHCVLSSSDYGGSKGPGYETNLECCKSAYGGQMSNECIDRLESPPTVSPTAEGELDEYYPDYKTPWTIATCKNTRPVPSGWPTFPSLLACCKGAYAGQVSGACLAELPNSPTTSPTSEGADVFFYPDYNTAWSVATCKNELPLPFSPGSRPIYDTELECCKGAYGGQTSGTCLAALDSPPTMTPTSAGGLDVFYPDYGTAWSEAYCINARPLPSGRPTYKTMLECCKGAYGGQVSGKCLSMLDSPPTTSPTPKGGALFFYPDYDTAWSVATCKNELPLTFSPGSRPIYETMLECCKGDYGGQTSGACLAGLPSPPSSSPTSSGGVDGYYADYSGVAWSEGVCINKSPVPSGRKVYSTQEKCCVGAYTGQTNDKCMCDIDPCYSCKCGGNCPLLKCGEK